MESKKRTPLLFSILLVGIAVLFPLGMVYARYQASFADAFAFQAKPARALSLAQQQWQQTDDAHILTFSLQYAAEDCRVYLAATQGVTVPEALSINLTLPGDTPQTLTATASPIAEGSALYTLFGAGHVFRFIDDETGKDTVLDLTTEPCTLTVQGLESAAQVTSLLRLFIEYA